MSAAEAARLLDETQANVSYHLRRLHAAGLVVVAEEVEVRGGRAKRYRHKGESGEALISEAGESHRAVMAVVASELQRRAHMQQPGSRHAFTDAEVWVDPDTWARCMHLAREIGVLLHDAAGAPDVEGVVRASATISLFEMLPRGGAARADRHGAGTGRPSRKVGGQ